MRTGRAIGLVLVIVFAVVALSTARLAVERHAGSPTTRTPQRTVDASPVVRASTATEPPATTTMTDAVSLSHPGDGRECGEWCRDVCGEMDAGTLVDPADIDADVRAYLQRHVLFAMVTGSFERFFRIDIALCSWLQHVPPSRVVVITDNSTRATSAGVEASPAAHRLRATWVEGVLPPGVKFTKRQLDAKGYTVGWIRAQFRFIQGLEAMAAIAEVPGFDSRGFDVKTVEGAKDAISADNSSNATFEPRWFVVLDDDTFTGVTQLVKMLKSYDQKLCHGRAGDPCAGKSVINLKPTYIGERGWGGAGHVFNYAAIAAFLKDGYDPCVTRNMVTKFYASDVALKKCLPGIGVDIVADDRMSHCQATFLRQRLLSGSHVTSHVKRELDMHPRLLAMWRLRLYYQVLYQRNESAYRLLLDVGACAYGSCKIGKCQKQHDADSATLFARVSLNNSAAPWR